MNENSRYRIEFYFADNGVGTLFSNDTAQVDAWWNVFSKPWADTGHAGRVVSMALFDDGKYVKEFRHEVPVAA